MKTAELENELLDYWVARADRETVIIEHAQNSFAMVYRDGDFFGHIGGDHVPQYSPAYDWSYGGPIIERERIWLSDESDEEDSGDAPVWIASMPPHVDFNNGRDLVQEGATPLIAAMRAFVASKFGDEVEDIKEPS